MGRACYPGFRHSASPKGVHARLQRAMDARERAYGSSGLLALIDLDPDPLDDGAPFIDF